MQDSALGNEAVDIRNLIKEAAEQEGFPTFELSFGDNSTGDPAVWIWFLVEPTDAPMAAQIEALRRLRKRVEKVLFDHQIRRIPYIHFREAQAPQG